MRRSLAHRIIAFAARLDSRALEFRERNADGEFAPQTEGGPDPVAMARAYGPQTISGGGKAAVAGLGLAGVGLAAAALSRRKFRRTTPA